MTEIDDNNFDDELKKIEEEIDTMIVKDIYKKNTKIIHKTFKNLLQRDGKILGFTTYLLNNNDLKNKKNILAKIFELFQEIYENNNFKNIINFLNKGKEKQTKIFKALYIFYDLFIDILKDISIPIIKIKQELVKMFSEKKLDENFLEEQINLINDINVNKKNYNTKLNKLKQLIEEAKNDGETKDSEEEYYDDDEEEEEDGDGDDNKKEDGDNNKEKDGDDDEEEEEI